VHRDAQPSSPEDNDFSAQLGAVPNQQKQLTQKHLALLIEAHARLWWKPACSKNGGQPYLAEGASLRALVEGGHSAVARDQSQRGEPIMRKYLFHLALALVLSASFAVAQTTPNSEHPNSVTPQADKDKSPVAGDVDRDKDKDKAMAGAVDDDTIRRQVKEQLATNPAFASVNVDVNGKGHVTLSGDVPTKDDRAQAKNLAEAVPGVKKVKDHMKVNASAVSSTGAMSSTGTTSNQAATPSTAGSIAGNTEAQAGVAAGTQQSTTTSSTTAIPQSDVTGSQTTTQQTGQTGAQPSTMTSSSASTSGQGTQVQQIQQVFQQQNISNVQVVNNNNIVQLVGTVTSQQDKDKAEQLAKQAAPGITIQNNIQVSQSMSGATSNPPSASSSTSTSTTTTPPAAATQPPMGEASQQSAQVTSQSSTQPSAASTQSSTTTVPQSDVNAQSTTTGQTTSSTTQATPFGNIPTNAQTSTSTSTSNTVGQTGGGSDLQTQIEGAIKADTSVSGCNTNVNVTDSQIELTGTCPTGKEKQSIKRTAQSFAGNRRVVDHIRVTGKGSNDTTSPSSTNPSSGTNPPTSSGTTPPSSTEPKPPMF
jgi:osmotically-inducible protein OsmY